MTKKSRGNNGRARQVSLSQKAKTGGTRRRKKAPRGRIVLAVLGIVALVAGFFFVRAVWRYVDGLMGGNEGGTDAPQPYESKSTVAYYAFGLMGEDETADLQMLSLVCYDKQAKTVHVMQIPTTTYLGDADRWAVPTVGGVWGQPRPLDWCETCRRQVYAGEIADGRHDANTGSGAYCGARITQKAGSAAANLLDVFRYQYTLPLDNFYLLPQEAFVKLVDWVGGVDVELTYAIELDGTAYEAGVQTLTGQAALDYVKSSKKSVSEELQNLKTQRKVYAALFERLFECDRQYLDDEVLWPLMKGSTPVRTRRDHYIAEDITLMIDLVQELGRLPRENIAVYLLPGEAATSNGAMYYSVHKKELSELLNEAFNPDGVRIEEEHLRMTELANTLQDDLSAETMAQLTVPQEGHVEAKE